jgi:hypothetical protein
MDVSIKLNGSGLDFTGNVTLFQATQIMAFIAQRGEATEAPIQLITPPSKPELLVNPATDISRNSVYDSPRAAIDELGASSIPQKIVAIALYLGATSQNGTILDFEDVLAQFTKAGAAKPTHFSREVKKAVAEGFVYLEDKSTFRLLSKTDAIPQDGFPRLTRRSTASKKKPGAPAEKLTVRPEVASMPITTVMDGFKDYFTIDKRPDQILWILKYAQANLISSLNRVEIIAISSKLGGVFTSGNFASANLPNVTKGYITLTGSSISISAKGEQHVAELTTPKK